MKHASLFSGIGGFDLAAEWAGWTNVFNCEIDPFCRKVLKHHFPNAVQIGDIKQAKFKRDDRGNVYLRRVVADTEKTECEQPGKARSGWDGFADIPITDTTSKRHTREKYRITEPGLVTKDDPGCGWSNFPTQSPLRIRDDGFSSRLDGITVSKLRNESIKAGGNAIVPHVAFQIFQAIARYRG